MVVALVAASCGGAATTPEPSEQVPLETLTPLETPEESFPTEPPLEEPIPSDEPFPSEEPIPTEPPLVTPPPGTSISATECSDNTDEQDFYAAVVAQVDWAVYCPRLPAGWHLETGSYRLSGTGRLEITYENRSGSQLRLGEGAFCATSDGCVPAGTDAGAASFGDLAGTLIAGSDGSWAVVVDPSADVSYLLVGQSLDETTFRNLAAGLTRVEP